MATIRVVASRGRGTCRYRRGGQRTHVCVVRDLPASAGASRATHVDVGVRDFAAAQLPPHSTSHRLTILDRVIVAGCPARNVPLSTIRKTVRGGVAHSARRRRQPGARVRSVGATPLFIVRGRGAHLEDADGHTIDYVMSWGPLIHGHAPKGLLKALGRRPRRAAPASARRPSSRHGWRSASRC